jgi:hypothetical protein
MFEEKLHNHDLMFLSYVWILLLCDIKKDEQ